MVSLEPNQRHSGSRAGSGLPVIRSECDSRLNECVGDFASTDLTVDCYRAAGHPYLGFGEASRQFGNAEVLAASASLAAGFQRESRNIT